MKKFLPYYLLLLFFVTPSCLKEGLSTTVQDSGQTVEVETVIPARIEGHQATRVEINTANGICRWRQNDRIGIWATNGKAAGTTGAFNQYRVGAVVDGAVRLTLSGEQYRAGYAIYPYDDCVNEAPGVADGEKLQVAYPSSYKCALRTTASGKAPLGEWCPAPMVSINNEQKTEYDFYHIGGILTLTLTDVPTNTTQIVVTFEGDTSDPDNLLGDVTGKFSVTDAGTKDATVSLASGTGNAITFTELYNSYEKNMVFNIPLPAQSYARLQAITVTASGGTNNCTVSKQVEGWGDLARAQGKKLTIDFNAITGSRGTFRGYKIHPGILKWDDSLSGGEGGYAITDGADPLELLRYYGDDAAWDIYYHQWISLKNNLDGTHYSGPYGGNEDDIVNCYIIENGIPWKIPGHEEWETILNAAEASVESSITVNNRRVTDAFFNYRPVLVDLSEATDVLGTDYSAMGLTTEEGGAGTNTHYMSGVLLFPDGAVISCPGISSLTDNYFRVVINQITYPVLQLLLDGGCAFIPAAGYNYYIGSEWKDGGSVGCYWTTVSNTDGRRSFFRVANSGRASVGANYSSAYLTPRATTYMPVRLVSKAD